MKQALLKVVTNEQIMPETHVLTLDAPELGRSATAGQFVHIRTGESWDPLLRRPMSIYRVDKGAGQIEFLYKTEGRGTRGMAMLAAGDEFNVAGPLGEGFKLDPAWRNIVVLGRGVGLATLAPLSQLAKEHGVGVTAILSARNPGVVMSRDLFEGLGANVITVLDSDGSSDVANVENILSGLIADGKADAPAWHRVGLAERAELDRDVESTLDLEDRGRRAVEIDLGVGDVGENEDLVPAGEGHGLAVELEIAGHRCRVRWEVQDHHRGCRDRVLHGMDQLRSGIGWRGMAQTDPKIAYKKEGYELFQEMWETIAEEISTLLFRVRPVTQQDEASLGNLWQPSAYTAPKEFEKQFQEQAARTEAEAAMASKGDAEPGAATITREEPKIGRNDPCPCGSGKKYKKCHGTKG